MILYYITDRRQFPGSDAEQCRRVLEKIAEAAQAGVDYVQLREKDMATRDLERLARAAFERVRSAGSPTRLLINSRTDVALAGGADGVHLTSSDISAGDARTLWMEARATVPLIAVSCHCLEEVRMAESQGADFAVLAPIFGKFQTGEPGIGTAVLAKACGRLPVPAHTEAAPEPKRFSVLALGGVTLENAAECLAAGAAGIAGIRLFQQQPMAEVVKKLRTLTP